MRKYWKVIPVILLLLAGCHNNTERGVTITGEIKGLIPGDLISCVRPAASPDSIAAEIVTATIKSGGKFIMHIPIKSGRGDWYRLWVGSTPEPDKTVMLFLDSGEVHINSKEDFTDATYSGSNDIKTYGKVIVSLRRVDSIANAKAAQGIKTENPEGDYIGQWVEAHPSSALGTALLEMYHSNGYLHEDSVIAYFNRRKSIALNNLPARRLRQWIKETADILPGKIAPDFTMTDTSGKNVSLLDFRGKYVLVDFWASWCGPCRAENPNVVKTFNMFKDKGFTVLGVSLDQPGSKALWLSAIHQDKLAWTQVSDLKYFDNAAAKLYHILAIPSNFLLDPNGIIIARNLRGDALEHKLAEVLYK